MKKACGTVMPISSIPCWGRLGIAEAQPSESLQCPWEGEARDGSDLPPKFDKEERVDKGVLECWMMGCRVLAVLAVLARNQEWLLYGESEKGKKYKKPREDHATGPSWPVRARRNEEKGKRKKGVELICARDLPSLRCLASWRDIWTKPSQLRWSAYVLIMCLLGISGLF